MIVIVIGVKTGIDASSSSPGLIYYVQFCIITLEKNQKPITHPMIEIVLSVKL